MNYRLLIPIFLAILLLGSVNGLTIDSKKCFNDGHVEIVVNGGDNESKVYISDINLMIGGISINNTWSNEYVYDAQSVEKQYSEIATEEGLFNRDEFYYVDIDYFITLPNGDKDQKSIKETVDCPGLLFTCSKLGLSIDSCHTTNRNKFQAYLNILGLRQSEKAMMDALKAVTYNFETENSYTDIRNAYTKKGKLPINAEIIELGNEKYLLEANLEDNFVKTLGIRYDTLVFGCVEGNYPNVSFYDVKECTSEISLEEGTADADLEDMKAQKFEAEGTGANLEESKIEETEKVTDTQKVEEASKDVEFYQDYSPLKIMGFVLLIVFLFSAFVLAYLRRKGYI